VYVCTISKATESDLKNPIIRRRERERERSKRNGIQNRGEQEGVVEGRKFFFVFLFYGIRPS
jgi:hypothetical protein